MHRGLTAPLRAQYVERIENRRRQPKQIAENGLVECLTSRVAVCPRSPAETVAPRSRTRDARADLFKDPPRTLTISVGDHVARSFTLDAAGRQQTNVLLPAAMLGGRDRVDVHIGVDRPFVPANVSPGSQDTRELGIRVYRAAVERSSGPTP